MTPGPPPLRFPDEVRADLEALRPGLAEETERTMLGLARPCVAVTSKRVSGAPLRRSALTRLFGARTAAPALGPTDSKFGGVPYCEVTEDWSRHRFLGQVDLAAATAVLPEGAPRLQGLLRLDCSRQGTMQDVRVTWFASPSRERAVPAPDAESVGTWEAGLNFALAWTLPEGHALEALWPVKDVRWFEYETFHPPGYNADGFDEFHRLLGHQTSGLDEPYSGADFGDHELLWRLTFDNQAGFAWGTNWLYLLVPKADLAKGDLSRVVVTAANS